MLAEFFSLLFAMIWAVLSFSVPLSIGSILVGGTVFVLFTVFIAWAIKKFLIAVVSGVRTGWRQGKQ